MYCRTVSDLGGGTVNPPEIYDNNILEYVRVWYNEILCSINVDQAKYDLVVPTTDVKAYNIMFFSR